MVTPPDNRKGGESTVGDVQRSTPTPFLTKTYQMVDDSSVDDVISWNDDGSTFIVWNPPEFSRVLLPKYFKHNNFSSFVRQLNTYGFRKVMPDRWEFSNEFFRKGEEKLLREIQRKKIATSVVQLPSLAAPSLQQTLSLSESGEEQVLSSSNSPATVREFSGTTAELIGENERLRKENLELNKELKRMKNLCSNIYVMMSNYASNNKNDIASCELEMAQNAVKSLNLLPRTRYCEELKISPADREERSILISTAENISARLFGVPIGVKRRRPDEGYSSEYEMELKLQLPGGDI